MCMNCGKKYPIKIRFKLTLVKKNIRINTLCLLLINLKKEKGKKLTVLCKEWLLDMGVVFCLNGEQRNVKN